ncbi:hypothetical protein BDA99DRAFT_241030 [Phascolomyces articulosus]|uniref:Uncharacterized protein n=1 Tax=Phascolomyces articulosus TaxID=60185 RepID=A0AAD5PHP5_9FUNG|nr:hypothetical protein BDA99DRAFT_241030 [Phascolomyces articulosus]
MSDSFDGDLGSPLSDTLSLSEDGNKNGSTNVVDDQLHDLGVNLVDQNVLESKIMAQADKAIADRDDELDQKRLEKARSHKAAAQKQLSELKSKLKEITAPTQRERLLTRINEQATRLHENTKDEKEILERMRDRDYARKQSTSDKVLDKNQRQDGESLRDFLIRTGKITPFDPLPQNGESSSSNVLENQSGSLFLPGSSGSLVPRRDIKGTKRIHEGSHSEEEEEEEESTDDNDGDDNDGDDDDGEYVEPVRNRAAAKVFVNQKITSASTKSKGKKRRTASDDEYEASEGGEDYDEAMYSAEEEGDDEDTNLEKRKAFEELMQDDGREATYQKRLDEWIHERKLMRSQIETVSV